MTRHNEHKVHRTDATSDCASISPRCPGTMNIKCIAQMQRARVQCRKSAGGGHNEHKVHRTDATAICSKFPPPAMAQ